MVSVINWVTGNQNKNYTFKRNIGKRNLLKGINNSNNNINVETVSINAIMPLKATKRNNNKKKVYGANNIKPLHLGNISTITKVNSPVKKYLTIKKVNNGRQYAKNIKPMDKKMEMNFLISTPKEAKIGRYIGKNQGFFGRNKAKRFLNINKTRKNNFALN